MSEQRHLDLVDRLRGQYHLPVNDGAGPLNGSMTFSREFPTPPIQKEAADEIERLRRVLLNIIELDHHNHGPESRAAKIARSALNQTQQ